MPSIAPYVASSDQSVKRMLQLAKLKPGEILFDLGSGDGKIITTAAKDYGVKAIGVELREDLVKKALERIHDLGLENDVKVVHGDIFDIDISDASVVTMYLTT
ncbi:MAG: methyltransferase domain-containing protein, partial [Nitrososphaeria archaeon]|nr:methyltransferase domain-containing protein [Nitrososphaeria archaeon]NIQ34313.1 methyltransferase domain-containing protein [Nitrososphaeria archaeon]